MKKLLIIIFLLPILAHAQYTPSGTGTWFNTPDLKKWELHFGTRGIVPIYQLYQVDSAEINNSNVGQTATFNIIGSPIIQQNGLGTTPSVGLSQVNNTAATALSTIEVSPYSYIGGHFWNGTSLAVGWASWVTPSASGGVLNFGPSINGSQPPSTITFSSSGTIVGSSLQFGRALFSGSTDAASGLGQIINDTADLGATNDNDDLAAVRLNNTFSTATGLATIKNLTGGTLYTNGLYHNVPIIDLNLLSKSTSAIAMADVTVAGGAVTIVTPTTFGGRYTVNDNLTISASSIGGTGSGVAFQVATLHAYTGVGTAQIEVGTGGVRWIPILFTNAPPNPKDGQVVYFSDSTTATPGATITGTGSNHVFGFFNNVNWVVL